LLNYTHSLDQAYYYLIVGTDMSECSLSFYLVNSMLFDSLDHACYCLIIAQCRIMLLNMIETCLYFDLSKSELLKHAYILTYQNYSLDAYDDFLYFINLSFLSMSMM
jgi:hypothetical protein